MINLLSARATNLALWQTLGGLLGRLPDSLLATLTLGATLAALLLSATAGLTALATADGGCH
tara:strand:+ start:32 stop:217 length:186 start_codon:yes stop_codon:yes gene_type:complete